MSTKKTSARLTRSKWDKKFHEYETVMEEEIVKPNQTQSIRDILFRNTQGMAYDNYKTPFYEDQAKFSSISLNELQNMDLADKQLFLQGHRQKTIALENKVKDYQQQMAIEQAKIEQAKQLKADAQSQTEAEAKTD